jgi:hypothetical protein
VALVRCCIAGSMLADELSLRGVSLITHGLKRAPIGKSCHAEPTEQLVEILQYVGGTRSPLSTSTATNFDWKEDIIHT